MGSCSGALGPFLDRIGGPPWAVLVANRRPPEPARKPLEAERDTQRESLGKVGHPRPETRSSVLRARWSTSTLVGAWMEELNTWRGSRRTCRERQIDHWLRHLGVRREGVDGAGQEGAKGAGRTTETPRTTGGQSRDGDANPSIFVLLLPFRVLPLLLLFICSSSSS